MWKENLQQAIDQNIPLVLVNKPNSTQIQLYIDQQKGENCVLLHRFDSKKQIEIRTSEIIEIELNQFEFSSNLNLNSLHQNLGLDHEAYLQLLEKTIEELKQNPIHKIVISRLKAIPNENYNLFHSFLELAKTHPSALVYLWHRPNAETWIGATPELLLSQNGNQVQTVSLAGTKSPEKDWTPKELLEQQIVTDYIISNFEGLSNIQVKGPETVQAGKFQHLKSYISGEISEHFELKNLLDKLHPTPAVCGLPKKEAFDFILQNEGYDRDFYSGYIGIENPEEKQYFVNLRCAQVFADQVALYLGGGILANSIPENEWLETELKSTTIKNGLVQ